MNIEVFKLEAEKLGYSLTDQKLQQFQTYQKELGHWNQQMNLTSITEPEEVMTKHFLDSLSVIQTIPQTAKNIIDIGAGAGFPGIPVKIARPDLELTLLESVQKKITFLEHIIKTLHLENTRAICGRAEDLARNPLYREQFDVAVSRGVANLSTLIEYALPFVKKGGYFIAQKSESAEEEITQAQSAIKLLGGKIIKILPITIPTLEPRVLVVVEKVLETSEEFPRRAGIPLKKPLS